MRQTVAVGVIKATTPKIVEGKATKAAQKADKKVRMIIPNIDFFLSLFFLEMKCWAGAARAHRSSWESFGNH